jgi:putative hydrolase
MDPVAGRVVEAIGPALTGALPAEVAAMAAPLMGVMQQVGGVMFGAQVGQAIGNLAGEVVSSTDIGLPLGPLGRAALLPANVRDFGAGLGIAEGDVRLYLALREAAHHRLFGHVGWLRSRLLEAVEAFARGIRVDTERLDSAIRDVDPTDLQSLQQALTGGLFEPETTDEQRAALDRLETLLALVEGWVDEVVDAAAAGRLPAAAALRETVRRRRAAGGPGEQAFAALVGLQLRPRRLREAAALWHAAAEARGTEGRDRIWDHPDLLPGSDDLDHPEAFLARPADEPFDLSDLDRTQPPPEPPQEEGGEPG